MNPVSSCEGGRLINLGTPNVPEELEQKTIRYA